MDFEKVEFDELSTTTEIHPYSLTIADLLETGETDKMSQYNMAVLFKLEKLTRTQREEFIIHQWRYLENRDQWMRQFERLLENALSDGHASVFYWNRILKDIQKQVRRVMYGKSQNAMFPILNQENKGGAELEKIKTNFTVDELSLLFALLIEADKVDGSNKKKISRTLAKVFETKSGKSPNPDSINNKFSSPHYNAYGDLKELFERLPELLKNFEDKRLT